MGLELPETLIVARQMDAVLPGKQVRQCSLSGANDPSDLANATAGAVADTLRRQGFSNLTNDDLRGVKLGRSSSHGKWIFTALDDGRTLCLAIENGGCLLYHPPGAENPADRMRLSHLAGVLGQSQPRTLRIDFEDGSSLVQHITGWGWALALTPAEMLTQRYPGRLGYSPLDRAEFSLHNFQVVLERYPHKAIRHILLLQAEIAGIGNRYLSDILFTAKVHPRRPAKELTSSECEVLHVALHTTLKEAVRRGGSRLQVDLYGKPGGYAHKMSAAQHGHPCPRCGTPIQKTCIFSSICYFCPTCQVEGVRSVPAVIQG